MKTYKKHLMIVLLLIAIVLANGHMTIRAASSLIHTGESEAQATADFNHFLQIKESTENAFVMLYSRTDLASVHTAIEEQQEMRVFPQDLITDSYLGTKMIRSLLLVLLLGATGFCVQPRNTLRYIHRSDGKKRIYAFSMNDTYCLNEKEHRNDSEYYCSSVCSNCNWSNGTCMVA